MKVSMIKSRSIRYAIIISLLALVGNLRAAENEGGSTADESWKTEKPKPVCVKGPSGEAWSDCPVDSAREPVTMHRSMWSGPKNTEVPHVNTRWPITDVSLVKPWGPYPDG